MYLSPCRSFFVCFAWHEFWRLTFFNFGELSCVRSLIISSTLFPLIYSSGTSINWLFDCLDWPSVFIFSVFILFHFCCTHWESSLTLHSIPSIESFNLTNIFKFSESFFLFYLCSFSIASWPCFSGCVSPWISMARPSLSAFSQLAFYLTPPALQGLCPFCSHFPSLPFSLLSSLRYFCGNSIMLIKLSSLIFRCCSEERTVWEKGCRSHQYVGGI